LLLLYFKNGREAKKGFVFDCYYNRVVINNNSVAVYDNKETKEVALVREYGSSDTKEEPIFMSYKDYNNLDSLGGANDLSNLCIILNKFFDCNFTTNSCEEF
jgi:hypothetical protein